MISEMGLSEAQELDQSYERGDPYSWLGQLEAEMPLGILRRDERGVPLPGDPSRQLRPQGGGKRVDLPDYSPAVKKMLERNKNRSQHGPNWRDNEHDDMQRWFYADHSDLG